jgi:medium-chain acyl-[acyl-carrier-protein] hydrolase
MEALVEALAPVIIPYLDVPFAFFGHSMGGLVSFELIHELHRQHDLVPVHLLVAGHRAPQLPDQTPVLHHLPEYELLSLLRRLNATPEAVLQDYVARSADIELTTPAGQGRLEVVAA